MMHFIDTTVLVGAADRRDENHDDGRQVLEQIPHGKNGTALVSDLVLNETATILGRRRGPKIAVAFVQGLLESPRVRCVFLDQALFGSTVEVFLKFGDRLSFADASTVAIMRGAGCRVLFSHDRGFDGIPGVLRKATDG